jgi:creatinine amidohydrolase
MILMNPEENFEKFLLAEMTWPEVKNVLKETNIAVVSVSSTEQHGPHLPVKTDAIIGYSIIKKAVSRLYNEKGIKVVIAPPIHFGMSLHHISFPGTISLKPWTLHEILVDVCWSLSEHGFKKIIIVNSHGGNRVILDAVARRLFDNTDAMVFVTSTGIGHVDDELNLAKQSLTAGPGGSSHAGETETSIMMALGEKVCVDMIPQNPVPPRFPLPEYVGWGTAKYSGVNFTGNWNTEELTDDGYLGDPSVANKETGEKLIEYRVSNMADFLEKISELEIKKRVYHQPP